MSWINWLTSFTRLRPVIVTVILQNCWALEQNSKNMMINIQTDRSRMINEELDRVT
jgi:hypothetical protein